MKDFVSKDIIETETVDNTAVNILTQIDRLSKSFTRLKEEYDFLSERVHPNGLGSLHYFWGSGDDVVRFSNEADRSHVIQSLLSAGRLLAIMEDRMKVLEGELAKVPPLWWRSTGAPAPGIRATGPTKATKVGRNDPCPCGSGKSIRRAVWAAHHFRLVSCAILPGYFEAAADHSAFHSQSRRIPRRATIDRRSGRWISIIFVLSERLPNISTADRNLYVRLRFSLEYKHSIQVALSTSLADLIVPFKITILAEDDSKAMPSDEHFA
jgi:SEC-C motif